MARVLEWIAWREQHFQCNTCDGTGGEGDEEGEAEESNSESELLLEQTLKKQQYRKRKRRQSGDGGEGDGEVETVTAEIPVDILRRISPLCEKMGLTIKCYACYVITLMLCFIYFQRFSVKSWLGYLSGTRVLAAWMNCLEGARKSSCGSLKVEIRSGKNHFFKTLITLWQKVTHWLNASQNDRKSKGFAFKTPGAALTMQNSAAVAKFAAVAEFAAAADVVKL